MDLSIIIPCFNRENTIERAIYSVLNQTYFSKNDVDFEIIVVDDCSTDSSVKVVQSMNNSKVMLKQLSENRGGNYARNYGVKISKGKFIAFQDSDDEWLPDKLEKQFNFIEENKDLDIVFSSLISDDNGIQTVVPEGISQGKVSVEDFLSFNKMSTQVILGKRDCFVNQPFDESLTRFQDWELAIRLAQLYNMFFIQDPLAIQYIQSNSITRNNKKAFDSLLKIEELHKDTFRINKKYYSKIFESIAYFAAILGEADTYYLKRSLQVNFSFRVFIKLVLSTLGLYSKYVKQKNKK